MTSVSDVLLEFASFVKVFLVATIIVLINNYVVPYIYQIVKLRIDQTALSIFQSVYIFNRHFFSIS